MGSSRCWARSEARRPCARLATYCQFQSSSTRSSICWSPWPARCTGAPTVTISSTSWRLRQARGRRTRWSRPPPGRWRSPARWEWTSARWSWSASSWRCRRPASGCCSRGVRGRAAGDRDWARDRAGLRRAGGRVGDGLRPDLSVPRVRGREPDQNRPRLEHRRDDHDRGDAGGHAASERWRSSLSHRVCRDRDCQRVARRDVDERQRVLAVFEDGRRDGDRDPEVVDSRAGRRRRHGHGDDARARGAGAPEVARIDTRRNDMVLLGMTSGGSMPDDMGSFRVDIEIENPARPGERRTLRSVLVDTGAELSWVPAELLESLRVERNNKWRFRQADGTILERWTGGVSVYVAGKRAADEVVFAQPGDLGLLGSRTLEGLHFRIGPVTRPLVDPGPAPAAVAA